MILIDDRIGSKDLLRFFPKGSAKLTRLAFGDLCWTGNGPEGPLAVGVERKRLTDLIASMYTDRLTGHQIPGMLKHYRRVYLVVEGVFRVGDAGLVMIWKGRKSWAPLTTGGKARVMASQLWGFLQTLTEQAGVVVVRTQNAEETAKWAYAVSRWWDRPYEQHQSHLSIKHDVQFTLRKQVPLVTRIAAELPGVGVVRARKVGDHFGTPARLFAASADEWMEIAGIGKGIADKVVTALKGVTS